MLKINNLIHERKDDKCESCRNKEFLLTKEGDIVCINCGLVKEERIAL